MKKFIVIGLIVILLVIAIYYRHNLIDLTGIKVNIKYHDISSENRDWTSITGIKDGFIEVASVDTHARGYGNYVFFKGWKPYEKVDMFKKQGKLYIFYNEKNESKDENVIFSFPLNFKVDEDNTLIYVNGELVNRVEFVYGIE